MGGQNASGEGGAPEGGRGSALGSGKCSRSAHVQYLLAKTTTKTTTHLGIHIKYFAIPFVFEQQP